MRHAVVVAPPGFVLPEQGQVFAAGEPVGPTCAALSRAGHRVVLLLTTADLEGSFERALGGLGPDDDLLVFVAGETTAAGALHLPPGSESLPLRVLADAVATRGPRAVLWIVEGCHDATDDDPMTGAEHVDALLTALDVRARGTGALVGVRPAARAVAGAWPFSRRLLYALGDPEALDASGAAPISRVVERLRTAGMGDGQVQSFAYLGGAVDYALAEAPDSARAPLSLRVGPPSHPAAARAATPQPPASVPAPSSRRASLPPPSLPTPGPLLALADGARERGDLDEALAGYKAALMVTEAGDGPGRATVYARLGQVKRAQGKAREAELNFDKALGADPTQRLALDGLVELAVEGREPRREVEARRRRLAVLATPAARAAELGALAATQAGALGDALAAAATLEDAYALCPADAAVGDALREACGKLQRWPRVVALLAEAAERVSDPVARAGLAFEAADVALARARDEGRGLALLERALEDDPRHERALQALVAVRSARQEWAELDRVYAALVDRHARRQDADRAWEACRRLAVLRRDRTRDVPGAIEAFRGAVSCKPEDVDSRAMLADMHLAQGDEPAAIAAFAEIAAFAPTRASTYARLFSLHQRAGRTDRALLAGMALEELGAADVDHQLLVDQFRPEGAVRPGRPLDAEGWALLQAPGLDDVVTAVLGAVTAAALEARLDALRKADRLPALDPARRQAETSTVSAVRSLYWAAQVLGQKAPAIFVQDEVPGGIAAVPAAEPTCVLGPGVVSGLGTKDLAFLAGRQVGYLRPEALVLAGYPTLPELSALFLGAVKLILPAVPVPQALGDAATDARRALSKRLSGADKERLAEAVQRLDARDGRVDLAAWLRSAELTAQRAGLLLCGDLRTAMGRLRAEERGPAELPLEARRADLLAFSVSHAMAQARERLGVEAHRSLRPPA